MSCVLSDEEADHMRGRGAGLEAARAFSEIQNLNSCGFREYQ